MLQSDFRFVVDTIFEIIEKRKYYTLLVDSDFENMEMTNGIGNMNEIILSKYKKQLFNLIFDLRDIIKIEMRYVLIPFPEIKQDTFEIGKISIKNFFEWALEENNYTPEKLMSIFTEDLFKLEEMEEILNKE